MLGPEQNERGDVRPKSNQGVLRNDDKVLRDAWSGRAQRAIELRLELMELGVDDLKGMLAVIERDISDVQKTLTRIETRLGPASPRGHGEGMVFGGEPNERAP